MDYRGDLPYSDSGYIYNDSDDTPQAIINAYILATSAPISLAEVTNWVGDRISGSAFFTTVVKRSPLDLAPAQWSHDESFDITNHVFLDELPSGTGIDDALARIAEQRLDLRRPPWEVRLLRDVLCGDTPRDVFVLKVHHCAADGIESANLGRMLLSEQLPEPAPIAPTVPRRSLARALSALPGQVIRYLRGVHRLGQLQRELAYEVASGRIVMPEQQRPRTLFNAPVGCGRTVGSVSFSLTEARTVRSRVPDTTVNDLMLATVSGALTRYLTSSDIPPALATLVPKDVRAMGGTGGINQALPMIVDLHTTERDPEIRVAAIHASVQNERVRRGHPVIRESVDCAATIPPLLARLGMWWEGRRRTTPIGPVDRANTVVSNYMRELEPLALAEADVIEIRCVPLLAHDSGLAHMVASVNDVLTLTFTADSKMMAEPGHYATLLRSAFDEYIRNPRTEPATHTPEVREADQTTNHPS